MQKAYIENNKEPSFKKLLPKINVKPRSFFENPLTQVIDYLNAAPQEEGFIFQNYTPGGTKNLRIPRMYFTDENGKIIDGIRKQIEIWKNEDLLTENEYYILLACLLEAVSSCANHMGTFFSFRKTWRSNALKKLTLRPIEIIVGGKDHKVFNRNSVELISEVQSDILYLDPPYNQRQYGGCYHLLETIAKHDNPIIKGVAGIRDYEDQKSRFCNAKTALEELFNVAKNAQCDYLVLSYSDEGIMPKNDILFILSQFGKTELVEFNYPRYNSHPKEKITKKFVKERLYILTRRKKMIFVNDFR